MLSISGYGPGYVALSDGSRHAGPIFLCGKHVQPWDGALHPQAVLTLLEGHEVDLLILGSRAHDPATASELRAALKTRATGLEIMEPTAAFRVYNLLVSDGRQVAAMLDGMSD